MNSMIFWRLFWKEYRSQRALWIAMALLTAFLLWLIFEFSLDPRERTLALFRIAVAFPALYALGCAAMLFAGEQEAETFEFLRSLPLSAWQVLVSKIVPALLGVVSLLGLTWLLAAWLNAWKLPDARENLPMWATFGLSGLEMFLWATFFSLLLKRVLMAAILGVAAASVGAFLLAVSVSNTPAIAMGTYVAAVPGARFWLRWWPWPISGWRAVGSGRGSDAPCALLRQPLTRPCQRQRRSPIVSVRRGARPFSVGSSGSIGDRPVG